MAVLASSTVPLVGRNEISRKVRTGGPKAVSKPVRAATARARVRNARRTDSSRLEVFWFVTLLFVGAATFLGRSRVAEAAWVIAVLAMVPAMLRTQGWYPKGWKEPATGAVALSVIFFSVAWVANWRVQMTGSEQLFAARVTLTPAQAVLHLERQGVDLERDLGMKPSDVEWILTHSGSEGQG